MSYQQLKEYFYCGEMARNGYNTAITNTADCYGFELEMEFNDEDKAVEVTKAMFNSISNDKMYLDSDGSMDCRRSFELKTNIFKFSDMMEFISNEMAPVLNNIQSHELDYERSGIHISLSFANIARVEIRRKALLFLAGFIHENKAQWECVSGRRDGKYYRYMSQWKENIHSRIAVGLHQSNIGARLNGEANGRIEVRTFATTADPALLKFKICMVHALKLFSLQQVENDNLDVNCWGDFKEYVQNNISLLDPCVADFMSLLS